MVSKQDFYSNILDLKKTFLNHFRLKACILFTQFGFRARLLIKYFGLQARILFMNLKNVVHAIVQKCARQVCKFLSVSPKKK